MPNYNARQFAATGVGGFVTGAATRVATDLNPEAVTNMVPKSTLDPETGSSIVTHVANTVIPHVPAATDIIRNAVDTGWKTAAVAAGALAVGKGVKKLINRNAQKRQLDK